MIYIISMFVVGGTPTNNDTNSTEEFDQILSTFKFTDQD